MTDFAPATSTKTDTSISDLDLEALIRFVTVTEFGSFAEAARVLGISRQAVHRSIDALEKACGGPLLDRDVHGLRPTIMGRKLLPHARELRDVKRKVRATIDDALVEPSGLVRLTAPALFAETVMAPAIARFLLRWPAVRIVARFDTARSDLLRDDFDLMVRIGADPEPGYFAVQLGQGDVCLCASPVYLSAHGTPNAPEDLPNHSLLEYARNPATQWKLRRGEEERTVEVNPRIAGDSAAVVVRACCEGLGILRVPRLAVVELLEKGEVVPVLGDWQFRRAKVWAIYGHRSETDPTLAALLEALREVRW
jgi:DNA-binding transcriptional LysR family regulator